MPELDPFDSVRDAANVAQGRDGTPDQGGKPKKKDVPAELGGSGTLLAD